MSNINVSVEKVAVTTYYDFSLNNNWVERSWTVVQKYNIDTEEFETEIISLYGWVLTDEERNTLFDNIEL